MERIILKKYEPACIFCGMQELNTKKNICNIADDIKTEKYVLGVKVEKPLHFQ